MSEIIQPHFHWRFRAFNTGVVNPVEISVIGYLDEASALMAVKDLIQRDQYELIQVWECTSCNIQKEWIKNLEKISGWIRK